MTPVHLYGVLEADAVLAAHAVGLDGREVRALPVGNRWCAWISDIGETAFEATPRRLREHDAVLRRATEDGYSVVPSLVGRLHADDAALAAALERHASELDQAMVLIRGRVEMSFLVAVSGTESEPSVESRKESPGPGRAHLDQLRNRIHAERLLRRSAFELAQFASGELRELVVAERVMSEPAPPVLEARAHLVARENIARYLQAAQLRPVAADPALRVAVRGPGAAYSFAAVQIG